MSKNKSKQPLYILKNIILTTLGSSGILIDKITPLRFFVLILILINIMLTNLFRDMITLNFAIVFFIGMYLLRYWILFTSFGKNGFAQKWIKRFGEEKAYALYEAITGVLFFYRSSSFYFLVVFTAYPFLNLKYFTVYSEVIGWSMITVATVVNVWSTMIVGIDVYYYKDMFVNRAIGNFEMKGPFRYFSNPMYGIGQLNGYGLALLSESIWGILASVLNQVTIYIFYFLFEKPHIKRLFGEKHETENQINYSENGELAI